eukprot:273518-Pyramimonas_sp.AAC.1
MASSSAFLLLVAGAASSRRSRSTLCHAVLGSGGYNGPCAEPRSCERKSQNSEGIDLVPLCRSGCCGPSLIALVYVRAAL